MIVSNTTPISNLLHVGRIDILFGIFERVYIPQAVKEELHDFFEENQSWNSALHNRSVIVLSVSNTLFVNHMTPLLHRGEIEAICLAMENNARLCLMDDKDGRDVAIMNNVQVTGTLGIFLKAKAMGLISSVKVLMDKLRDDHHFWVSHAMYQRVLDAAKEG